MKSKILLLFIIINCTLTGQNNFINRTNSYFTKLWVEMPQEKVYLHTDKPYYSAGDSIWFKAYVINATTHLPNTKSNFVYVELINEFDSVISRIKIKKDSLGFSGRLSLNAEIAPGNYVLRAYTYWMQNSGADFFFNKQLKIGNDIDDRLITGVKYGKQVNGNLPLTIQLLTTNAKPYDLRQVKLEYYGSKKKIKPLLSKTNQNGEVNWVIPIDSLSSENGFVKLSVVDQSLKFSRDFKVPTTTDDFDVQFFPESGNLLTDNVQVVAFKAIGKDGLSINITGKIFDNENNEITDIKSVYKGLGRFSIFARDSASYYAIVKNENGIEKKFILPKVSQVGVGLQLVYNRSKIFYEIKPRIKESIQPLYLLAHSRGVIYILQPLSTNFGQIEESDLPAGVTSFSVVDSLGNVYCERLFFTKNKHLYNINIRSNKNEYKKRDFVSIDYTLTNNKGVPLSGFFSLSVTDKELVNQDTTSNNIISHFLLQSDIKGHIEDPADYFNDLTVRSIEKLDLLMLTQGWRRFDLSDYLKRKLKRPDYYLEMGQAVSGQVKNLVNNPSKGCDVILVSSNKIFRVAVTDSLGQYLIDGIQFPDSTSFLVKARKRKSLTDVEVIPDKDIFPASKVFIPWKNDIEINFNDYLKATKEKYYTEGGMRIINLDEFTITANNKSETDSNPLYAGADKRLTAKDFENYLGMRVLDMLQTIPGIVVNGETISIRGSNGMPLIIIDGFESEDITDLIHLSVTDIEEIAVFKGVSASIFGSKGGNGAIAVTLKKGVIITKSAPISIAVFQPLGFQKPVEFYSPKYLVENDAKNSKLDLRTTIYWADKLKCDENGTIKVHFYAADYLHNYDYTLEGVTSDGQIIRKTGIIKLHE